MSLQVAGSSVAFEVVPVIDAVQYTAEDQLGDVMAITGAAFQKNSVATLVSLTVADKSKQTIPMTLFFFNQFPSVSSVNNGMLNVPDSEMATKCIGHVAFTSADYAVVSGSSIATVKLGAAALTMKSKAEAGTVYAIAKVQGAPTYAVGDLLFRYLFARDS